MTNTRDNLGHVFTVNKITIQAIPETHNVIGPLDQLGQLVDLARLDGEKFKNYKHRVLDTYVNRANATYRGLINGITRELGLLPFDAMTIDIKPGSDGLPEAPRVIVDSTQIILYNKWNSASDYEIDRTINIYKRRGNTLNAFFMEDLVSEINSSNYFTAVIGVDVDPKTRSNTLIRTSSDNIVGGEFIPAATSFRLQNQNIVSGTIFFEEVNVFKTLKSLESQVQLNGDYFINFITGRIVVKSIPSGNGRVRYISRIIPFVTPASPIFGVDFKDLRFREEIFKTEILDDGTVVHGIPNPEAVNIINELFSIKEMYWGK